MECNICPNLFGVGEGFGDRNANVMIVKPQVMGNYEADRMSNKMVNNIISWAGFRHNEVYTTYAVRCRGDVNRAVMSNCSPYLLSDINNIRPKLIICFGANAAGAVLGISDHNTTKIAMGVLINIKFVFGGCITDLLPMYSGAEMVSDESIQEELAQIFIKNKESLQEAIGRELKYV